MHQALPNKAQDSTVERGTRVKVTEAEVQVKELSLAKDQCGPQFLAVAPRAFLPFVIYVRSNTMGSVGDLVQGVSTVARKAISLGSALS